MSAEIELKLLLPEADPSTIAQTLRQHPALASCDCREQQVFNRYYDTPDQLLRQQRAALRLRHISSADTANQTPWWQTFKTAGTSIHGLSQRGEWESTVPSGQLNAQALQATPWAELDPHGHLFAQLQPCFETNFNRTTWQVACDEGTHIEVALDCGHIVAHGRTQPLLELELELKAGPTQALTELAQQLGTHLKLLPSDVSKAERGYALAQG